MSGNYSGNIKSAESNYLSAIRAQSNYSSPAAPNRTNYVESVNRPYKKKIKVISGLKWIWGTKWVDNLVSVVNETNYNAACIAVTNSDTNAKNSLATQVSNTGNVLSNMYSNAPINERTEIFLTHYNKDNTLLAQMGSSTVECNQIAAYAVEHNRADLYNFAAGKVNFDTISIGSQSAVGYAISHSSPLLPSILKATNNYSQTIEQAIKSQNKDILDRLYTHDKSIFATKINGLNLLEIAISQNLEQMVSYFLSKDASLINGDSVFVLALKTGSYNIIDQVRKLINIDNEIIKLSNKEQTDEVKELLLKSLSFKSGSVELPLIFKLAESGKLDVLNYLFKNMTNAEDIYRQALSSAHAKDMKDVFGVLQQVSVDEADVLPLMGVVSNTVDTFTLKLVG
jgi:hypothetical protein